MQRLYDVQVRYVPYLLDPTTPPEGKPRRPQTQPGDPPTYMEERGASVGLTFTRGRTFTSNSHLALEAAEFAAEQGHDGTFHRAMFKAYFEDLADIGKIETVLEVGKSAGLDQPALADALESRAYRRQVDEGIEWARAVGVTGVPTFIFQEQWAIVGAQESEVFDSFMSKLGQQPRTE